MIGEAIVAGAVATVIGMLRVDAARYVFWHNHVAKRWFVPIIVIQALAFAGSGVAAWALAHLLGVEGVEDKWLLNGCIFGVAGYLLLGFQLDALDVDKLRSPYVPLKFIAEFGRKLLDALALNQIESLPDAELAERAWLLFWDKMYPDASIAATVRDAAHAVDGGRGADPRRADSPRRAGSIPDLREGVRTAGIKQPRTPRFLIGCIELVDLPQGHALDRRLEAWDVARDRQQRRHRTQVA